MKEAPLEPHVNPPDEKTVATPRALPTETLGPSPTTAQAPNRASLAHRPIIGSRRIKPSQAGINKQSLAPLFLLVVAPIVLSIGVVIAIQTAFLRVLGLNALAMFVLVWTGFCLAELFAVPMVARARGKDPGIWFVVTVIWLCFETFLAVFAHIAGWVTFAVVMAGIERGISPALLLTGIVGVVVSAFFVYLPLWALLLSSPGSSPGHKLAVGRMLAQRISSVRARLRNPFRKNRLGRK